MILSLLLIAMPLAGSNPIVRSPQNLHFQNVERLKSQQPRKKRTMATTIHKQPERNKTPINSVWYQPDDNELGLPNAIYAISNGGGHSLSFHKRQKMSRLKLAPPTKSWLSIAHNIGLSLSKPELNPISPFPPQKSASRILVAHCTVGKKTRTVGLTSLFSVATKRNKEQPEKFYQETTIMMMPKGKISAIPKLSQSHIRFPKSPSEKSPGDKESGEIPDGPFEFRNLRELAAPDCESLWNTPPDPRVFHTHTTVIEPICIGPNTTPQEDRVYAMKIEADDEPPSKQSILSFFEQIHNDCPETQPAEAENLAVVLSEQLQKLQAEIPLEDSVWIPINLLRPLESLFMAFWKAVQHHTPDNPLSRAYGSMLDHPETGTGLFANMIINLTCQWLAVNNGQIDELSDASFYPNMTDMETMVTPINHAWVWIHLSNMFSYQIRILFPSQGMVAYLEPDVKVHGGHNRPKVYFVVYEQRYYVVLPDDSPVMQSLERRTSSELAKIDTGLQQPPPQPALATDNQTTSGSGSVPTTVGMVPMEVTTATPNDAVLQALLAKVAEMQATISALTNVVTAQSAATNQIAAVQFSAAQNRPMSATKVPPVTVETQQPLPNPAQANISAVEYSLPPKATVRTPAWIREPPSAMVVETSSVAQKSLTNDPPAIPRRFEATPISAPQGKDRGEELQGKARAIYFAHYDTSIVMVHLRGLSLLTNEDGFRAQIGA